MDFFAGIGGLRLGFEQACADLGLKARCVLSSEIDSKACNTYSLNFGETPQGDIREIFDVPQFDFLLAGFPCQPFSYAGKRLGFGDTRGTLFSEIERILSSYHPDGFILENVRGLLTHDEGRTFATIEGSLKNLGYRLETLLLNSCDFGVPQNRMRIYIVGSRRKKLRLTLKSSRGPADSHAFKRQSASGSLFSFGNEAKLVKDILEAEPDAQYLCSSDFVSRLRKVVGEDLHRLHGFRLIDYRGGNSLHSWELGIKGECTLAEMRFMNELIGNRRKKTFGTHQDGKMLTRDQIKTFYDEPDFDEVVASLIRKGYLKEVDGKFNPVCGNMSFEVFKFLDPDSISITLTSSDAHRLGIVQNNQPRRITPRECARLQGFPDSFKLPRDEYSCYAQFGNAVSVPVIFEVARDFMRSNVV